MAANPARLMLRQGKTALLICDVQTRFSKIIFGFDAMIANTTKLISACKFLQIPMLVTEQAPKSLGSTVAQLDISGAAGPFAKTQFSMCTPEVKESLAKLCSGDRPESVLLAGIEGHVCIENTAIDLRTEGYEVHAVADCISSRTQTDRLLAFERMRQIGCVIATSENVVYKMLGDASHEQFRNIQGLMRTPSNHYTENQSKL